MATLAPNPGVPERVNTEYERKMGPDRGGREGDLRHEEGLATDTDVPNDFAVGVAQGDPNPGRPNHNRNVFEKPAEETLRERAHVGSASWLDAESLVGEFANEVGQSAGPVHIERIDRPDNTRFERRNPARIND